MKKRILQEAGLILFCMLVFGLMAGCSNMYEGFKASKLEDCYRLSYPDQEECFRETDISYETYEAERKSG